MDTIDVGIVAILETELIKILGQMIRYGVDIKRMQFLRKVIAGEVVQ